MIVMPAGRAAKGALTLIPSLDFAEKREVLRAGSAAARGGMPVVTGVADDPARNACRLATVAEKLDAVGPMVRPGRADKAKPAPAGGAGVNAR